MEGETSTFLTATIAVFAIILFVYKYIFEDRRLNLPPGPIPLPFIGNLHILGADVREPLLRLKEKYGDVVTLYMGSRRVIFLSSYDAIKEAFVKQGQHFAGRPKDLMMFKDISKGRGLTATDGPKWRELRKFTHGVLREFGVGRPLIEEKINEELSYFLPHIGEEGAGGPLDLHKFLQISVSNIICSVVFGKRNEYTDPTFVRYMTVLDENFKITGASGPLTVMPQLKYLPGDLFNYHKMISNCEMVYADIQNQINTHRANGVPEDPQDFIDAFLNQAKKEENNPNNLFTDPEALVVIGDLFVAGTETTSTTLYWGILYMILNPNIQEKVQKEIMEVVGENRRPSYKDKQSMPYTEACIMEIQRMADLAPLALPHTVTEDVILKGYNIPKGTWIMANLTSVHRDPDIWNNPYKFDPDRFLDSKKTIQNKEHLVSFSMGKRVCLGESLARMELFLFFTSILQRFTFSIPPGDARPSDQGVMGLSVSPLPYKVVLKRNDN